MRYATIEEAQKMEFGVTGDVRVIDGDHFERLEGDGCFAWAVQYRDEGGDMVDWDYLSEEWAQTIGLLSR